MQVEDDEPDWRVTSVRRVQEQHMLLNEYGVLLPSGESTTYAVDDSQRLAAATLLIDGEEVILSRQYRFPLRRWIFDLPGGACRPGESAEDAAVRECQEELGLEPQNLNPLTSFYPNPGRSSWFVQLFHSDSVVASSLKRSDPSETVRAARMEVAAALGMLDSGGPLDAGLAIALHAAVRSKLL